MLILIKMISFHKIYLIVSIMERNCRMSWGLTCMIMERGITTLLLGDG